MKRVALWLAMWAAIAFVYVNAVAWSPSAPEDGSGRETGDTLDIYTDSANVVLTDTIGPAFIGECQRVWAQAQWSGDSVDTIFETAMDGIHWIGVVSLCDSSGDGAGIDDSVTVAYNKLYIPTPDSTTGLATPIVSQWARLRLIKTIGITDSSSQVHSVWGAIRCAR